MTQKNVFSTSRLYIRELIEEDFIHYCLLQSEPLTLAYQGASSCINENRRKFDFQMTCYQFDENEWRIWAIVSRDTNEFVGTCAVVRQQNYEFYSNNYLGSFSQNDLSVNLFEKHWCKGYASELLTGMITYCFNVLKYPDVMAEVDARHIASIKVLEKKMQFQLETFSELSNTKDRYYFLANPRAIYNVPRWQLN